MIVFLKNDINFYRLISIVIDIFTFFVVNIFLHISFNGLKKFVKYNQSSKFYGNTLKRYLVYCFGYSCCVVTYSILFYNKNLNNIEITREIVSFVSLLLFFLIKNCIFSEQKIARISLSKLFEETFLFYFAFFYYRNYLVVGSYRFLANNPE
jgi:hypothetical protein